MTMVCHPLQQLPGTRTSTGPSLACTAQLPIGTRPDALNQTPVVEVPTTPARGTLIVRLLRTAALLGIFRSCPYALVAGRELPHFRLARTKAEDRPRSPPVEPRPNLRVAATGGQGVLASRHAVSPDPRSTNELLALATRATVV